jgi:hypothetical protein
MNAMSDVLGVITVRAPTRTQPIPRWATSPSPSPMRDSDLHGKACRAGKAHSAAAGTPGSGIKPWQRPRALRAASTEARKARPGGLDQLTTTIPAQAAHAPFLPLPNPVTVSSTVTVSVHACVLTWPGGKAFTAQRACRLVPPAAAAAAAPKSAPAAAAQASSTSSTSSTSQVPNRTPSILLAPTLLAYKSLRVPPSPPSPPQPLSQHSSQRPSRLPHA